jgi:hypothetical protein
MVAEAFDATSGVASIRLYLDGAESAFLTLPEPAFSGPWNTNGVADGMHGVTARAMDRAGNLGATGAQRIVLVDNHVRPSRSSPRRRAAFRDRVVVREGVRPVSRVDFTAGGRTVTGAPDGPTYEADSTSPARGQPAATTAVGLGRDAGAAVGIVVDRGPVSNASLITAEERTRFAPCRACRRGRAPWGPDIIRAR